MIQLALTIVSSFIVLVAVFCAIAILMNIWPLILLLFIGSGYVALIVSWSTFTWLILAFILSGSQQVGLTLIRANFYLFIYGLSVCLLSVVVDQITEAAKSRDKTQKSKKSAP